MKVTPAKGPMPVQTAQTTMNTDARSRAIAMLQGQAPGQAAPVANPSAVTAEEMPAVKQPLQEVQETEQVQEVSQEQAQEPQETPVVQGEQKKDDSLSSQYSALVRKEKALRAKAMQQEQAWKTREAELAKKQAEYEAKIKEYESGYISKQKLRENTLEALAEAETSYEKLTQDLISNSTPIDPRVTSYIQKLEAKLAKLEESTQQTQKAYTEQQEQSYKAAVRQIKLDATELVKANPDDYEGILKTNSISDVVELIEKTFQEDGRVMSVEEAAQEVENYLIDEADRLSQLKKVQARRQQVQQSLVKQSQPQVKQSQPMKTLTNAAGSTRKLTAKERAILAFKGELKS